MKYRDSQLDIKLKKWFSNSLDQQLLRGIELKAGRLRGLTSFSIEIDYPLLAIAGRNGAGKSTILAMAACAFHNKKDSILKNRNKPYYTFADFFIQCVEEIPPEGVFINYKIAHNNWVKNASFPEGKGIGYQARYKKKGGKWNNYDRRVNREVLFLGIERIVPHSEKSQSKSYSKYFSVGEDPQGWEEDVKDCVGHILNKKYDDFKFVSYSKYRLPIVTLKGKNISGFNMGAGENALFEIFSILHACSEGALVIIDEIELGLHAEAQIRLIEKIKSICLARKIQIIFTTHSDIVFGRIPIGSRVFIENTNDKTDIKIGISPEYAFSKLSSDNSEELDLLVEDTVAEKLLINIIPCDIRSRIKIEIVGSASSLSRQLAAIYQRKIKKTTLVVFDGDQKKLINNNLKYARSMIESDLDGFDDWFKDKVCYLPGDEWPEKWIISKNIEHVDSLCTLVKATTDVLKDILIRGEEAEKHKEFFDIASPLGLNEKDVLDKCCLNLSLACPNEFDYLINKIQKMLDS